MSWRLKLFALLFAFSVIPVALLAAWTIHSLEQSFLRANLAAMAALASAKASAIDQFTADRKAEVETMDDLIGPALTAVLKTEREAAAKRQRPPKEPPEKLPELKEGDSQEEPEEEPEEAPEPEAPEAPEEQPEPPPPSPEEEAAQKARDDLRRRLGLILWDQQRFEELIVIDKEGRVISSTFGEHEKKSAAKLSYFLGGRKGTHVEPVFISPITDQLTMVISTPIRDENLEVMGVLAARLNLSRFFRVINDTTGLGSTGETVVAKKIGEEIVFMAPTRHDPGAALNLKIPLGSEATMGLQEAARGQEGAGMQNDYRGACTVAAWHHVPSLDWGLLAKIDCTEAERPVREVAQTVWYLLAALFILGIAFSLLAARALVQPLRQLREATERISRGDFDVSIDIQSRDEIGELAESFERMVAAIKFFQARARGETEADENESPNETD